MDDSREAIIRREDDGTKFIASAGGRGVGVLRR